MLWLISALALAGNVQLEEWPQVALFVAYFFLSVWGFASWGRTADPAEGRG